jgi:hypothetical protein
MGVNREKGGGRVAAIAVTEIKGFLAWMKRVKRLENAVFNASGRSAHSFAT